MHRAKAARWLTYPLTAAATIPEFESEGGGGGEAAAAVSGSAGGVEPWAMLDALRAGCALCSELALGDGVTAAAAQHLLTEVLPPGGGGGGGGFCGEWGSRCGTGGLRF